mgnify:FL=1
MSAIAIKLLAVALRQVSRPIANIIKIQAKEHEMFRNVCMRFAQRMHKVDATLRDKITPAKYRPLDPKTGKRKTIVRPLNDAKAVESGATILSEFFVFGVASSLVIFETVRQMKKETVRREQIASTLSFLENEIEKLREEVKIKDVEFLLLKEDLIKKGIESRKGLDLEFQKEKQSFVKNLLEGSGETADSKTPVNSQPVKQLNKEK